MYSQRDHLGVQASSVTMPRMTPDPSKRANFAMEGKFKPKTPIRTVVRTGRTNLLEQLFDSPELTYYVEQRFEPPVLVVYLFV